MSRWGVEDVEETSFKYYGQLGLEVIKQLLSSRFFFSFFLEFEPPSLQFEPPSLQISG